MDFKARAILVLRLCTANLLKGATLTDASPEKKLWMLSIECIPEEEVRVLLFTAR